MFGRDRTPRRELTGKQEVIVFGCLPLALIFGAAGTANAFDVLDDYTATRWLVPTADLMTEHVPPFTWLAEYHDQQLAGQKRVDFTPRPATSPVSSPSSSRPADYSKKVLAAGSDKLPCKPGEQISRIKTSKKVIALLIADGPGTSSQTIVSTLKNADAHASFFLDGQQITSENQVDRVHAMLEAGQEIGSQGYSHSPDGDTNASEQHKANAAFKKAAGAVPGFYRAPSAAYTTELRQAVTETGQCFIEPTPGTDRSDWKAYKLEPPAASHTLRRNDASIVRNLRPGQIIPVHEQPADLAAQPGHSGIDSAHINNLVNQIQDAGYKVESVGQALQEAQ